MEEPFVVSGTQMAEDQKMVQPQTITFHLEFQFHFQRPGASTAPLLHICARWRPSCRHANGETHTGHRFQRLRSLCKQTPTHVPSERPRRTWALREGVPDVQPEPRGSDCWWRSRRPSFFSVTKTSPLLLVAGELWKTPFPPVSL